MSNEKDMVSIVFGNSYNNITAPITAFSNFNDALENLKDKLGEPESINENVARVLDKKDYEQSAIWDANTQSGNILCADCGSKATKTGECRYNANMYDNKGNKIAWHGSMKDTKEEAIDSFLKKGQEKIDDSDKPKYKMENIEVTKYYVWKCEACDNIGMPVLTYDPFTYERRYAVDNLFCSYYGGCGEVNSVVVASIPSGKLGLFPFSLD